ncbi:MAG: 50S ribosomal protein L10 [Nitrospiraceae bacterium]|nr:50S ribosomal protein L10 [Nitrospiraceae bacterium]
MALKFKEKEILVKNLHEEFSKSVAVIMTRFSGLNVTGANELRKRLRESGAELKVSKNTFFRRAIEGTPAEMLSDYFSGPNAVVFAFEDPVAVAKVLVDFAKDNESIELRGGILSGQPIDLAQIETLSELPSWEVLIAQMLSVLVAVPTGFVRVLSGMPRKLLYALRAIEDQKR